MICTCLDSINLYFLSITIVRFWLFTTIMIVKCICCLQQSVIIYKSYDCTKTRVIVPFYIIFFTYPAAPFEKIKWK